MLVVTTMQAEVPLPAGWRVALASGAVTDVVPPDTTVWLVR